MNKSQICKDILPMKVIIVKVIANCLMRAKRDKKHDSIK